MLAIEPFFTSNYVFHYSRHYLSNNMKRAKDNSGSGYSYGSALASLGNSPLPKSPISQTYSKNLRCTCKTNDQVTPKEEHHNMHILRTTAIKNEPIDEIDVDDMVSKLFYKCLNVSNK